EQSLHGLDALITRTAAAARVLGLVRSTTVEPSVLPQPVVDQTRHVLASRGLIGRSRAERDLTVHEAHHQLLVHLTELGLVEFHRRADLLPDDIDDRIDDSILRAHVWLPCVLVVTSTGNFGRDFRS